MTCDMRELFLEAGDARPMRQGGKLTLVPVGPRGEAVLEKLFEVQAGGLFVREADEIEMCLLGLG